MTMLFEEPTRPDLKPEIEVVEKEKMEYTLLAKVIRRKGLKLFAYNFKEATLNEVILKENKVLILEQTGGTQKQSRFQANADTSCNVYFEALNFKSAINRLKKFQEGKVKDLRNLRVYNGNPLRYS